MGSGEWVWRPLMNPPLLQINAFEAGRLVGFGLMQRDREFDHYQDLEACYESRPSVWITPRSDWRNGHIELVQIPTGNEINDNIVAFWVPGDLKPRGEPLSFSYTMSWQPSDRKRPSGGRVVATRTATGKDGNVRKFVIDFAGEVIESLPADEPLTAVVTIDPRTRLVEQQLHKNRVTGGWRLVFQVMVEKSGSMDRVLPQKEPALEFRSFLKLGERAMTETWSYALPF
jgi:glucans biosynthesis protein